MTPYYDEDGITIYHGDCREIMPGLDVAVIITDPPYGVGKQYGEFYDDRDGPAYWEWFGDALSTMRAAAPIVVFTHRVAALRHITDWDWVYIWHKPRGLTGLNHYPVQPHWEPVFTFGIGGRRDLPRGFDVFSHSPALPTNGHPTPKPVGLFTELIQRFAMSGTLLDPFMGSGTTLRAAKNLGVRAIGIEIEERYCELAIARLAQGALVFE